MNNAANNGFTPVHIASNNGQFEIVYAFLAAGANVNRSVNNGNTPLQATSTEAYLEVVKA